MMDPSAVRPKIQLGGPDISTIVEICARPCFIRGSNSEAVRGEILPATNVTVACPIYGKRRRVAKPNATAANTSPAGSGTVLSKNRTSDSIVHC